MATYTVIGGDQKQYGSVTAEQLCQWIAGGRVNAQTQLQTEGAPEWKFLSEMPEFAAALAASRPPPLPPAMPAAASAAPARTSGLAITSLILGIAGMFTCGLTGLFGLILGIIAMVKVKNSGGKLKGSGLALAGIIVSGIFLFMLPIFAALLLPALASAHDKAREFNCINNEKELALAVRIHMGDNKDQFPPVATWCDAIQTETGGNKKVFRCPAVNSTNGCDYAFNARLDGMDASKVSPQTVMIFESDAGWNASGGSELLPARARHGRGKVCIITFVDGHVEAVNRSRLNTLRWDP